MAKETKRGLPREAPAPPVVRVRAEGGPRRKAKAEADPKAKAEPKAKADPKAEAEPPSGPLVYEVRWPAEDGALLGYCLRAHYAGIMTELYFAGGSAEKARRGGPSARERMDQILKKPPRGAIVLSPPR